jgi:hypothetical protein
LLLVHRQRARSSGGVRCLLGAHILQEVTELHHDRTDVALDRLRDANPAGRDGSSGGGSALPVSLSMQLSVADLRDAALGVRDAWNHGVLLRACAYVDLQRPS